MRCADAIFPRGLASIESIPFNQYLTHSTWSQHQSTLKVRATSIQMLTPAAEGTDSKTCLARQGPKGWHRWQLPSSTSELRHGPFAQAAAHGGLRGLHGEVLEVWIWLKPLGTQTTKLLSSASDVPGALCKGRPCDQPTSVSTLDSDDTSCPHKKDPRRKERTECVTRIVRWSRRGLTARKSYGTSVMNIF